MKRFIFSGAYVSNELQAEFGCVPPSFLPVGGVRLFEHQLSPNGNLLVLPSSFIIPEIDAARLKELDVEVLVVDPNFSVIDAFKMLLGGLSERFEILMGDTLIENKVIADKQSLIGISKVSDNNTWDFYDSEKWAGFIFNGYLSCSNPSYFTDILEHCNSVPDLLKGLTINGEFQPIPMNDWLDFGHITTFFKSKRLFLTTREFNEIRFEDDVVVKTSNNQLKIKAELNWYKMLPIGHRNFTPTFLGSEISNSKIAYKIEYCPYSTLAELYVFGDLNDIHWKKIFNKVLNVSKKLASYSTPTKRNLDALYKKTENRIRLLDEQKFPLDFLRSLVEKAKVRLNDYEEIICHGDLCLSNILWDFRSERPKLIDPRGLDFEDNISTKLPVIYDLGKLVHSVHGLYDHIVFKRYSMVGNKILFDTSLIDKSKNLSNILFDQIYETYGVQKKELIAMEILLFVGLIPLHYDDEIRQNAFIANLKRLEREF
jgi:hypothetical protein